MTDTNAHNVTNGLTGLKNASLLRDRAYIGGAWVASDTAIEVINPATGQVLACVPDVGATGATQAVSTARTAGMSWRALAAKERSTVLRRWYDLICANVDDLARLLTAEQGKPLAEAKGEVVYAASFVEWFAEEAKRVRGDIIPGHLANMRLSVTKEPVGVVAAVTPWNFPIAMITRKVAPALAAGCTVVLKPSELTPLSALALAQLADEAGIPAGVFNVVTGMPAPIGEVLTGDSRVRKFTFTGSTAIGKLLAAKCAGSVKRVSLELGGNAPFIVFDDADIDQAVAGAMASKFRNSGQTCVCANRLLVQDGIYDLFAARLSEQVARLVIGDGLAGPTDQGPLIDSRAVAKAQRHVDDALSLGATRMIGADPLSVPSQGTYFPPTVLTEVTTDMILTREETFGPVAGLIRFHDEATAISIANDTAAGLAAYVFTRDGDRMTRVTEGLEYGMIGLNTGLISTEMAPFGGVKESGLGREGSHYGIEEFLNIKMVCRSIAQA